ncbi:hypothetical protein C6T65_12055 [Burkholderia vietnamiensis]|uniref:Uncharacterized protein n=1 Tax=Burkholderia vietnamiensis TaxID=60552 RepID=A0AA44Y0N0_BURVI|nr:hypothetical protein [Burkholderia vietnamiensis]PRH42083.1 hypothetical protein C6T65_12055 [Burkholderia vietnamiensis]
MTLVSMLAGAAILLLAREFFPGYFRKKGENLATKEDIAEITKRQEEIKHKFNEIIEASKQRHSLRTLVAEKRMAAHQHAFKHVKGLLSARENKAIIEGCKAWMDENCLYLTLEARRAVWRAIGDAESRALFLAEAQMEATANPQRIELHDLATEKWNAIMAALPTIVTGVELPPLGDEELAAIRTDAVAKEAPPAIHS